MQSLRGSTQTAQKYQFSGVCISVQELFARDRIPYICATEKSRDSDYRCSYWSKCLKIFCFNTTKTASQWLLPCSAKLQKTLTLLQPPVHFRGEDSFLLYWIQEEQRCRLHISCIYYFQSMNTVWMAQKGVNEDSHLRTWRITNDFCYSI